MRRMRRLLPVVLAVCALTVGAVSPAGGQEFGFLTIDPMEGPTGEVVDAQVDTTVVAENCVPDVETFQATIAGLMGLGEGDGSLEAALTQYVIDRGWDTNPPDPTMDPEFFAMNIFVGSVLGILGFVEGAAESAYESLYVLTFADIADQSLVGERGGYDPLTGEGQVTVPDVAPGMWAVAAVCLGWNMAPTTDGTVAPAIAAGAEWILANVETPYPGNILDPAFAEIATEAAPAILGADPTGSGILNVYGGPWVELFCVWDASGACPQPDPPIDPVEPEQAAEPVSTAPRFTG